MTAGCGGVATADSASPISSSFLCDVTFFVPEARSSKHFFG